MNYQFYKFRIPRKYLSALIFVLIFLNVSFVLSFFKAKDTEICAADNVRVLGGTACDVNYGDCPDGYQNLFQNAGGKIALSGVTVADLRRLAGLTQLGEAIENSFCVRDTITAYVYNQRVFPPASSNPANLIACIGNTKPSELSSREAGVIGANSWGCCPGGYQYVADYNTTALGQRMICCKVMSGQNKPIGFRDGICKDADNKDIDYSSLPSGEKAFIIPPADGSYWELFGVEQLPPVEKLRSCPGALQNGCAIPTQTGAPIKASDVVNDCFKCFGEGENMTANLTTKQVFVCGKGGVAVPYPFINGTINDTLAYLASQEASGDLNAEQLKGCRESGGIYIAVGCVDPTPLGILTGLIRIAFGIMGGVALAQLIYAGIMYQSGDEAKIAEARSKVLSTIAGVAVLVFSVLILRIIGVNVLDILPAGAI